MKSHRRPPRRPRSSARAASAARPVFRARSRSRSWRRRVLCRLRRRQARAALRHRPATRAQRARRKHRCIASADVVVGVIWPDVVWHGDADTWAPWRACRPARCSRPRDRRCRRRGFAAMRALVGGAAPGDRHRSQSCSPARRRSARMPGMRSRNAYAPPASASSENRGDRPRQHGAARRRSSSCDRARTDASAFAATGGIGIPDGVMRVLRDVLRRRSRRARRRRQATSAPTPASSGRSSSPPPSRSSVCSEIGPPFATSGCAPSSATSSWQFW